MSVARKRSASFLSDATRCALAAVLVTRAMARHFTPPNVGCTPNSSGNAASLGRRHRGLAGCWGSLCSPQPTNARRAVAPSRRPSAADFGMSREPGVQPRVRRAADAMCGGGDKDSSESAAGRVVPDNERLLHGAARARGAGVRFRASSLVTFFWPRRRKLPACRGGLPAPHSPPTRRNEARPKTTAVIDAPPMTTLATFAAAKNPRSTRASNPDARSSRRP